MSQSSIDIIIPVLNEEAVLIQEARYYNKLKEQANVVFVDGGSIDQTAAIAKNYGQVISSRPGRGWQKDFGVQQTQSEYLLFLHVDSYLSDGALESINRCLKEGAIGGCLSMRIDDNGFLFRIYEKTVNVRAQTFGIIDGDLGMFVRRDMFNSVGGFGAFSVMEDIIFSKKLRQKGRIEVLPDVIHVSSRKWHERGFIRTFWDYTVAYLKLWTGGLHER